VAVLKLLAIILIATAVVLVALWALDADDIDHDFWD